jgi:membrane associated rhomboid family serine protease
LPRTTIKYEKEVQEIDHMQRESIDEHASVGLSQQSLPDAGRMDSPRVFPDLVVASRRARPFCSLVLGVLALSILNTLGQVVRGHWWADYWPLGWIPAAIYVIWRIRFAPQVTLRAGEFRAPGLRTPATNVAGVAMLQGAMWVWFSDAKAVALEKKLRRRCKLTTDPNGPGAQARFLPGLFSISQVFQIRKALGLPGPAADARAVEDEAFLTNVVRHRPRPLVSRILCGLNLLAMAAIVLAGSDLNNLTTTTLVKWGANYPSLTFSAQPWRLVTYAFLHAGFVHLFMNLWSLLLLGPIIERLTGTFAFIVIYVASAIAGGIASAAWHPALVSVGASGAIVGIVGAVAGIVLTSRGSLPPALAVSLRNSVVLILVMNAPLQLIPHVDMACHVGGLVGGFVCGAITGSWLGSSARRFQARVVASAIVAILALSVAYFRVPIALHTGEMAAVWDKFYETQTTVLAHSSAMNDRIEKGQLNTIQAITIMQNEMIRPWKSGMAAIRNRPLESPENRLQVEKILTYMDACLRSWELYRDAMVTGDKQKYAESASVMNSAGALAQQAGLVNQDN